MEAARSFLVVCTFLCFMSFGAFGLADLDMFVKVIPANYMDVISKNLGDDYFDGYRLKSSLQDFTDSVYDINGSASSVFKALVDTEGLFNAFVEFNSAIEKMKGVNGFMTSNGLLSAELATKSVLIDLSKLGGSLSVMIEEGGGTQDQLEELLKKVGSVRDTLEYLSDIEGLDIDVVTDKLSKLAFDLGDFNFSGTAYKLIRDLPDVALLKTAKLKGSFEIPFVVEAAGMKIDFVKSGFTKQILDLEEKTLKGVVGENINIWTFIDWDKLAKMEDLNYDYFAKGKIDAKDLTVDGLFKNDISYVKKTELLEKIDTTSGLGAASKLDGSIDLKALTGKLDTNVSTGGGATIASDLVNGGSGFGSNVVLKQDLNLKDLTNDVKTLQKLDAGGGIGIGDKISLDGGAGVKNQILHSVDLKELKGKTDIIGSAGGGTTLAIGDAISGGGLGGNWKLFSDINLSDTTKVGLKGEGGANGNIKLPGNLGGLYYDVKDVTDLSASFNLSDLSERSIEILKSTDILAIIDLPGSKLDPITIEAHPSIDFSKIGNLNVGSYADKFANDCGEITKYNMLTEVNLLKALVTGSDFLARLEILDAFKEKLGYFQGLSDVFEKTKVVLVDMASILDTLQRVKVFPGHVRTLGDALANLGKLNVNLPQLEALGGVPLTPPGLDNFGNAVTDTVSTVIPQAGSALSDFAMGQYLGLAEIGERVSSSALQNVAGITGSSGIQNFANSGGLEELMKSVPALAENFKGLANGQVLGGNALSLTTLDLEALQLNRVLELAKDNNIDLNDYSNLQKLTELAGLDYVGALQLEKLVSIGNLQEFDLNTLQQAANLYNLDILNTEDLTKILTADLSNVVPDIVPVPDNLLGGLKLPTNNLLKRAGGARMLRSRKI